MPPRFHQACPLADAAIDLQSVRDDARSEFLELLEGFVGTKYLILDANIGNLLSHILTDASQLFKDMEVVQVQELGGTPIAPHETPPNHILFFVRPSVQDMRLVAGQIFSAQQVFGPALRYNVFFAPHKTLVCEQVLEDEGVLEFVDLGEYQLNLIPLEADVISLELERSFCECKIHGDTSSLQAVTQSIMKLQHFFGVVPNVKSIGPLARDVAKKLCRERVEGDEPEPRRAGGPDIDTLILIDRDVDLVTPMVTPLTYEGLIDELIGVRNSIIKVDRQIAGEDKDKDAAAAAADAAAADADAAEQGQPPQMVSITLNSNDKLYAEIRDQNIEKLGPFLGQKAKEIRGEYNKFRSNKDASINEIHDFVKLIPGLKENYNSLSQHINITEEIKRTTDGAPFRSRWNTERALLEGEVCYDLLEDMIAMQEPELMVLRLLCLQSMTNGGLKGAKFDFLRREMIQTYGYEMLFTLNNLEKLGMLRRREMQWMDSGSAWSASRKNLRLINEDVNVMSPNDVAFVSSGYAPMSVRLVQYAVTPGWASVYSSTLQLLSRPAIEFTQRPEAKLLNVKEAESRMQRMEKSAASLTPAAPAAANGGKKVMVVYYIGGITFMEIAALRFLSNEPSFPFRIIICTTKLVNGDSLLRTLLHEW